MAVALIGFTGFGAWSGVALVAVFGASDVVEAEDAAAGEVAAAAETEKDVGIVGDRLGRIMSFGFSSALGCMSGCCFSSCSSLFFCEAAEPGLTIPGNPTPFPFLAYPPPSVCNPSPCFIILLMNVSVGLFKSSVSRPAPSIMCGLCLFKIGPLMALLPPIRCASDVGLPESTSLVLLMPEETGNEVLRG
jgi:hypothetical protein